MHPLSMRSSSRDHLNSFYQRCASYAVFLRPRAGDLWDRRFAQSTGLDILQRWWWGELERLAGPFVSLRNVIDIVAHIYFYIFRT